MHLSSELHSSHARRVLHLLSGVSDFASFTEKEMKCSHQSDTKDYLVQSLISSVYLSPAFGWPFTGRHIVGYHHVGQHHVGYHHDGYHYVRYDNVVFTCTVSYEFLSW